MSPISPIDDTRGQLPGTTTTTYLTDGGIETYLVFIEQIELPEFAVFPLLDSPRQRSVLERWYRWHAAVAVRHGMGFILETPTWRASSRWGSVLGYGPGDLERVNVQAVIWMARLRDELASWRSPMRVSGCVGPLGDGYTLDHAPSIRDAQSYHTAQVEVLADAGVDMVTALTMTNPQEAVGIANAAARAQVASVISFTTETDGMLPSGHSLAEAIAMVDELSLVAPAYYMVNCAHPSHFACALDRDADWVRRLRGLRANASAMSHAELDCCDSLDDGDPLELGAWYRAIVDRFPHINVLGGCCGTDVRHVEAIARACTGPAPVAA